MVRLVIFWISFPRLKESEEIFVCIIFREKSGLFLCRPIGSFSWFPLRVNPWSNLIFLGPVIWGGSKLLKFVGGCSFLKLSVFWGRKKDDCSSMVVVVHIIQTSILRKKSREFTTIEDVKLKLKHPPHNKSLHPPQKKIKKNHATQRFIWWCFFVNRGIRNHSIIILKISTPPKTQGDGKAWWLWQIRFLSEGNGTKKDDGSLFFGGRMSGKMWYYKFYWKKDMIYIYIFFFVFLRWNFRHIIATRQF